MVSQFKCKVDGAQVTTDSQTPPNMSVGVGLTDLFGAFNGIIYQAVDEAKREMLAVSIAAISNQNVVVALVDPSGGQCFALTLLSEPLV